MNPMMMMLQKALGPQAAQMMQQWQQMTPQQQQEMMQKVQQMTPEQRNNILQQRGIDPNSIQPSSPVGPGATPTVKGRGRKFNY